MSGGVSRRFALVSALALSATAAKGQGRQKPITVYKTESCGCCQGWVAHMRRAGYSPRVVVVEDIAALSARRGVPFQYSSCHMGETGGYVLVGHIPSADVDRLLAQKPACIGLSVPGMPWGSPGMESERGEREAYQTLMLLPGGKTRLFARHA